VAGSGPNREDIRHWEAGYAAGGRNMKTANEIDPDREDNINWTAQFLCSMMPISPHEIAYVATTIVDRVTLRRVMRRAGLLGEQDSALEPPDTAA
jgi:hypothetical protein